MDIEKQLNELLAGEGRYMSVHQQWEIAETIKKLNAVRLALIAERKMLGKGEQSYLPYFEKTQQALSEVE